MATLTPGIGGLVPRPIKQATGENYFSIGSTSNDISFFDGTTELPEVLEQEVERFGKRTIGGFLRMVGAEMPMASDRVVWTEQGRLHMAFEDLGLVASSGVVTFTATATSTVKAQTDVFAEGMTVVISNGTTEAKARVSAVTSGASITLQNYGALDFSAIGDVTAAANSGLKMFIFGSEYSKGAGESGVSVEPVVTTFNNKPIILRDKYVVDASDMAQIGWIEVTTEAGASGYLWYMKAESEARLRFEDQLEMAMVEAEKAVAASPLTPDNFPTAKNYDGMEGLFAAIEARGIQYSGTDFDGAGGLK